MQTSSEAFESMFRAHHDDLYRYALRRVGPDAAADVVAEVFLIAWRRRAEIPSDAARLWLFGVASNRVMKEYRSATRRSRLTARLAAEPEARNDPIDQLDTARAVRRALATLPEGDQEALRLTQWEGLTPTEAATIVGCSSSTFRVRMHRARRRFAAALESELNASPNPQPSDQDVNA